MTASNEERPLRFEPEEACPPSVALVVGLQGAVLVVAPTVLNVAIAIRSTGLGDDYLAWSVFAGMVVCGIITAAQALQFGRFGSGHVALTYPAAMFIAIMVMAIEAAGPATFASLMIVCSLVQVALAWWLPTLRRIITPTVSGTVTMLVAVSVLPIAFNSVQDLPAGAPLVAGPAIAGVTLLVSVIVMLRATGRWRLVAPFISILAGAVCRRPFRRTQRGAHHRRRLASAFPPCLPWISPSFRARSSGPCCPPSPYSRWCSESRPSAMAWLFSRAPAAGRGP